MNWEVNITNDMVNMVCNLSLEKQSDPRYNRRVPLLCELEVTYIGRGGENLTQDSEYVLEEGVRKQRGKHSPVTIKVTSKLPRMRTLNCSVNRIQLVVGFILCYSSLLRQRKC